MGIGRSIALAVAGTGLAAGVAAGLGGYDDTTRDDTGQIVNSGDISVFNVKVGDCLAGTPVGEGDVSDLVGVPCSEDHVNEVYAEELVTDLKDYDATALDDEANRFCEAAFESYVGISYNDSSLEFVYLAPSEESWAGGDNEITCMLTAADQTVHESFKNSKI
ncbi:MAG: hypothetical protein RL441_30 [Actinomycetota bacterium]